MRVRRGKGFTMSKFLVCTVHNIVRVIKFKRYHVARMEEDRSAFKILTGTPARKRSLRRSKLRW